jgi:hypothetical protein
VGWGDRGDVVGDGGEGLEEQEETASELTEVILYGSYTLSEK